MATETFEQYAVHEAEVADAKIWIKEQADCKITLLEWHTHSRLRHPLLLT